MNHDALAAALAAHQTTTTFVFSSPSRQDAREFLNTPDEYAIADIIWRWSERLPAQRSTNEWMADGFRRRHLAIYLRRYR